MLLARQTRRIALLHRRKGGHMSARAGGKGRTCDSGSTPGLLEGELAGWAMFVAEDFAAPP